MPNKKNAKLSPDTIQKILRMRHEENLSFAKIGREVGVNSETARRYCARFTPGGQTRNAPVDLEDHEMDQAVVAEPGKTFVRDGPRGTVLVDRADEERGLSPSELAADAGVDLSVYRAGPVRQSRSQSFYKVPNYVSPVVLDKIIELARAGLGPKEIRAELRSMDAGHRKVNLFHSRVLFEPLVDVDIARAIDDFCRERVKPIDPKLLKKTRPEPVGKKPVVVSWGIWDAHIGMYAWQAEVGADYDLHIALARVANSIDDMLEELRPYNVRKIWMPIGNDFMHFDSVRQTTAMGLHHMDTDSRYPKVFETALRAQCYMVERALEICPCVDVMWIPGNHDVTASHSLAQSIRQRYRNDPRVTVDVGASPRKWRTHGGSLVMWDHGKIKYQDYQNVLAQEAKDVFASSTYREVQVGHKHQRMEMTFSGVVPTNGVTVRMNPALTNTDAWHYNQALLGEPVKSVEAWRYTELGYIGSHVAWARDDDNNKVEEIEI